MESTPKFSDEQVMFTLAMMSYQGVQNAGHGPLNDFLLKRALDESLERLVPVRGRWELAWGPVTYAAPFNLFADSAAFVVRDRERPQRLAIVIRGTNPLSAFDWILGDIWVDRVVPWRTGAALAPSGASISLSTSLGLSILQNMRWLDLPTLGLDAFADTMVTNLWAPAERVATQVMSPFRSLFGSIIDRTGGELRRDLAAIRSQGSRVKDDLEKRIDFHATVRSTHLAKRTRERLDALLGDATGAAQVDLLYWMEGVQRFEACLQPGEGLHSFLEGEAIRVARQDNCPLEIFVTGHSKGGALAPVVAQWLSDTRRSRKGGWNPECDATIHSFAFAGPTPGNRAFAQLFEETFESRGHRISNCNDLVPHAWVVRSADSHSRLNLWQIPDLYRSSVHMSNRTHERLTQLMKVVAADVEPIGYAHVGVSAFEFEGKLNEGTEDFFVHMLNQHTTGYIQALGLEPYLNLKDMFTLI